MPDSIAYCDDCVHGMAMLPDECIDLTVTSPPYDALRDYHGYTFDWKATISQLYRITKVGGALVWIVSDQVIDGSETGTSLRQALYAMECGFLLHDTMIWEKPNCGSIGSLNRYEQTMEYMFVLSKGKPKTANIICDKPNSRFGEKQHGSIRQKDGTMRKTTNYGKKEVNEFGRRHNVWVIVPEMSNLKRGHPAPFPITLVRDHIITWSNEGDTVLDPFLGSGTTRIAAYDLNRRFIGYEIDKEYFELQEERFAAHSSQMNLFLEG